jgi:hypothetical protein
MANITRSALDALSSTNFPDNTSQLISPADLRGWLESGVDSFLTQKDVNTLENALYEAEGSALAASASVNLSTATGNYLHITGAFNGINSFGTCPAGSRFILVFDGVCTLTDSATLILPGGSDITTAAGDCAMLVSEGSGSWRMVGFFPISGGGGGGTVTSVTATTPLSSTGGATPDISIPQANATTDGYLDSTDWSTFNSKQDTLNAGTGISIIADTVNNTAPDLTVALTAGTGIGVTGTYPNFTISNTSPSSGGTITALTNDVTASGSGSVVATIANDVVTYAKMQNVSTNNRLLGRATSGAGDVEEITLGTGLSFSGTTLNASGGGSGTVNSGTANRLTYYAATGTAVSELPTAGSAGQILQSNGTGSAPSWVSAPAATLTLGTSIVSGATTAGRLLLTTTSGANQVLNQDSLLNYDTANDRLGIGVASPAARLDLAAPVAANPSLILAPSSGVTPTGTTNGSIWCDTTSSNTSLTMRKDSAYTKILTLDRNPDLATSGTGLIQADANGTLSKGADLSALGIYAQTNQKAVTASTDTSLIGTVTGVTTLPANFFGVGKTITIFVSGLYSQANSNQTCTISLKIGATTLTNTLSFTHNSTLTDVYWEAAFVLTCRSAGASGSIQYQGKGILNHATNPLFSFMNPATVSSINTTGTLDLDVVARFGNPSVNSIRSDIHYANYIN